MPSEAWVCARLLLLLASVLATEPAPAQTAAHQTQLAYSPTWLRLGHYKESILESGVWESQIHPGDFFLSPSGATDPISELQATVIALNAPPSAEPDNHAQCRYPARLQWLREQLGNEVVFRTDIACPKFNAWTQQNSVQSLSVVLASGFLGNPASFYGHTLLKFNSSGGSMHTKLLDVSVNYGAILEGRKDSAIGYIVRSLLGGYDAGFSHIQFYFHEHSYGDTELRDLWEYKLDLPQRDVDFIVAHAWEVLGKRFTYFFFRENCAYQMGEIIAVADKVDPIPPNRPWTIPQALIQRIAAARLDGRPLVSEITYDPSRQSRFYAKFNALSASDRDALKALSTHTQALDSADFAQRPLASQEAILEALIDYDQFAFNPLAQAPLQVRADYSAVLAKRYTLPAGGPDAPTSAPVSPDQGRPPGWAQAGAAHNSALGDSLTLRLRPAYYDSLDAGPGQVRNGTLSMGDTQMQFFSKRVRVDHVEGIAVRSLSPAVSGLPGDGGAAWDVRFGAEQARLWCPQCLVVRGQGDLGTGTDWSPSLYTGILVGGAIQNARAQQGAGFARVSVIVIAHPADRFDAQLETQIRGPVAPFTKPYLVATSTMRWTLGKTSDLRIDLNHDRVNQIQIAAGWYW